MPVARYDPLAHWYDAYASQQSSLPIAETLRGLLGTGRGRCLDVGCGTAIHGPMLQRLGWTVLGVDLSRAQLGLAAGRVSGRLCADGAALPVATGSMDAVVSVMTHTDVDDWAATVAEIARVLKPGASLVYVGVHPCFTGPFAQRLDDGRVLLHEGYQLTHRQFHGPGIGPEGVRARVGVRHLPLAGLLTTVSRAGLFLETVTETDTEQVPRLLGFTARAPGINPPISTGTR